MLISEVNSLIEPMFGTKCCLVSMRDNRSIYFAFDRLIVEEGLVLKGQSHGLWEIGSYSSAFRVISDGQVVLASGNGYAEYSPEEINESLGVLEFGSILSMRMLTEFDVRIEFSTGLMVDFLCVFEGEDEVVHIFCPGGRVVVYTVCDGWNVDDRAVTRVPSGTGH